MAVRRLKINRTHEGRPCNWCGYELKLGDAAALCESCTLPHHAECWDEKDGCGTEGCVNAPFKKVASPAGFPELDERQQPLKPDERLCQNCGKITYIGDETCRHCRLNFSGVPNWGPKKTAPEAHEALKYAIAGFLCCGFLYPVAIIKGHQAKAIIDADPTLGGRGIATTAQVIGIIGTIFLVIYILSLLATGGRR